jgi:hypothetical protein
MQVSSGHSSFCGKPPSSDKERMPYYFDMKSEDVLY